MNCKMNPIVVDKEDVSYDYVLENYSDRIETSTQEKLTLVAFTNDDFFHSKCLLKIISVESADYLSNLLHTKNMLKILLTLILVASAQFIFNFYGNFDPKLYKICYITTQIIALIVLIAMILMFCSLNIPLTISQFKQFETIFKLANTVIIAISQQYSISYLLEQPLLSEENTYTLWTTEYLNVIYFFQSICIVISTLIVSCIDAYYNSYCAKLIVLIAFVIYCIISFCLLVFGYTTVSNYHFTFIIPILDVKFDSYHLQVTAFENLSIYLSKCIFLTIYNMWIKKEYNSMYSRTCVIAEYNPVIFWHDSNEKLLSNTKNVLSQNTIKQLSLMKTTFIFAQNNNDFYHDNCVIRLCCCCNNYNINILARLSKILQTRRIIFGIGLLFIVVCVLYVIKYTVNISYSDQIILDYTVSIITTLFIFISLLLIILSFNVNLFKQQLKEFETIFKLYNVLKFAICEIMFVYQVTTSTTTTATTTTTTTTSGGGVDDNVNYSSVFLIYRTFMYIVNLTLLIIGISCIDGWPMFFKTKFLLLIFALFGMILFYFNTTYTRDIENYITISTLFGTKLIAPYTSYDTQVSAYATIILFLTKECLLLVYFHFNVCKCCTCKNGILTAAVGGNKPNMALNIRRNYIVKWKNGNKTIQNQDENSRSNSNQVEMPLL